MRRRFTATLAAWAVWVGTPASADDLRGRIVDDAGAPVAGVVLAPRWEYPEPGSPQPIVPAAGEPTATTDERGFFVLPRPAGEDRSWLALDPARARGVLVLAEAAVTEDAPVLEEASRVAGAPPSFALAPLVEFRGSYAIQAAGRIPGTLGTWVAPRGGAGFVATCIAGSERFGFRLPPGAYELSYSNGDLDHRTPLALDTTVDLTPRATPIDLPPLPLRLPQLVEVSGRALGPGGEPLAGVVLSRAWIADDGPMVAKLPHVADGTGRFVGLEPLYGDVFPLLALDRDQALAALVMVDPLRREPLIVRPEPAIEVRGRATVGHGAAPPAWTTATITLHGRAEKIALSTRADGTFSFRLPPGDYDLYARAAGARGTYERVVLRSGSDTVDLGTLALEPTVLAQVAGGPAPRLTLTDARGVPRDFDLEHLRGKWVALEFWGHWCTPCLRESLPALARLYRGHGHVRDRFEVLAIHDATVRTFEELDPLLAPIVAELWHGEPLPFPILLDGTGETVARYGITDYPSLVLIDPAGRVVPGTPDLEGLLRDPAALAAAGPLPLPAAAEAVCEPPK
jgi:thiol-disulfide isomerase/thioredoxin